MRAVDLIELLHLSEEQRSIAEAIGIEAYRRLSDYCRGTSIYIPSPTSIINRNKDKIAKAHYNGKNKTELCDILNIPIKDFDKIVQGLK